MNELIINKNDLVHNINIIKNYEKEENYTIFAVVKGNAYGLGVNEFTKVLIDNGINNFAVASSTEAINLRKNIKEKILLLTPYINEEILSNLIKNDITLTIDSVKGAGLVNEISKKLNKKVYAHIKIDTGLCRLGLYDKMQIKEVVEGLRKKQNIEVEGIFTHFATDGVYDVSWDNQYAKFQELTSEIDLMKIPIIHLGRSQTLLNHSKIPFANGIRLGIILYGYNTTPKPLPDDLINKLRKLKREWYKRKHHISKTITDVELKLKPAFSLYSEVMQVKQIKKGSFVGYGRIYEAPEDMYVAIIPIGYADGFNTRNKGRQVVINNKRYSLVGVINMGMIIAKVDENVHAGDKVTLIGEELTMKEAASYMGTSVYEGSCMINDWVPRVLVKDGEIIEIEERK